MNEENFPNVLYEEYPDPELEERNALREERRRVASRRGRHYVHPHHKDSSNIKQAMGQSTMSPKSKYLIKHQQSETTTATIRKKPETKDESDPLPKFRQLQDTVQLMRNAINVLTNPSCDTTRLNVGKHTMNLVSFISVAEARIKELESIVTANSQISQEVKRNAEKSKDDLCEAKQRIVSLESSVDTYESLLKSREEILSGQDSLIQTLLKRVAHGETTIDLLLAEREEKDRETRFYEDRIQKLQKTVSTLSAQVERGVAAGNIRKRVTKVKRPAAHLPKI